uniref:Uncharacterized protein n=2 Tax=Panagrolaimus sp. PS1159 TaxID=55785 RepID=A0AC35F1S1_9BILA
MNYYNCYGYYQPQQSATGQPLPPYYVYQVQTQLSNFSYSSMHPPFQIYSEPQKNDHPQNLRQPRIDQRQQQRNLRRFHESAPYLTSQTTPPFPFAQQQQLAAKPAYQYLQAKRNERRPKFRISYESGTSSSQPIDNPQTLPEVEYSIQKDEFFKMFKKCGDLVYLWDSEALKKHLKNYDELVAITKKEKKVKKEIPETTDETQSK